MKIKKIKAQYLTNKILKDENFKTYIYIIN